MCIYVMAPVNMTVRPRGNMIESMDVIDSSAGSSMQEMNNANRGEDVCGIRQDEINQARPSTTNFVDQVNATVGCPRTHVQRRRMRDLQLNHYYKLLFIQSIDTRQYGKQIIAYLISPEENVSFKVFLPSRMIPLFPDERAINEFQSRVTGLKILSLAENNSVNLEFLNNRESEDGVDINSVPESFTNEEFYMSTETLNVASRDELRNQLNRLRAEKQCQICLDMNKSMVFECGHGACHRCAESVNECHICRQSISVRIPLY